MNARTINQTFDLVGYVSNIVSLKKSGAYWISQNGCPVCGGKDRFCIKRTQTGDIWYCRHCASDKYHSAIDFQMAYKNLSLRQAFELMGGDMNEYRVFTPKPIYQEPVRVEPSQDWLLDAEQLVESGSEYLFSRAGEVGRRYLEGRGITQDTMRRCLLGFTRRMKFANGNASYRPAIIIPYIDQMGRVMKIRYRTIDGKEPKALSNNETGVVSLFGLPNIQPKDDTLFIVEGELNAVSLLQTAKEVSVVSTGSQGINGFLYSDLRALSKGYKRVIIWMDEAEKSEKAYVEIGRTDAEVLFSKVVDGVKWDASQFLQAGLLDEYLTYKLSVRCLQKES